MAVNVLTPTFRGKMTRQEHATDRMKHAASAPACPKLETPVFRNTWMHLCKRQRSTSL